MKSTKAKQDLTLINFKSTEKEKRKMIALAKKHAGGNLSAWIRYAATHCIPDKDTVIR